MIVINSSTRQFNIPGADLVFGVEADSGSTVKEFQCPRYVGNHLDLTGCFIRMNYRNANGEVDSYLVEDVTVDGDNVVFGWELTPKVTMYKGNVSFVMCVVGPDTKVKWHTTLGRGQVLEGLEPDSAIVEAGTADVVAQLIAMVEAQTEAVEAEGSKQIKAVQTAAQTAQSDAVAQIEEKGVNTRNSIPADYTALSEAVDGLVRGRAGAIICSVEGSAVVVNDGSDLPMQGLRIFGRSTQDGTPTPDAPVEIKSVVEPVVTVCGRNIINLTATPASKTYDYSFSAVTGVFVYTPPGAYAVNRWNFPVPQHGTLYLSAVDVPSGVTVQVSDFNQTNGTPTIDVRLLEGGVAKFNTGGHSELTLSIYATVNGTFEVRGVMVSFHEDTEYEPYDGGSVTIIHTLPGIPVTSGGNYIDSDGRQWICDEIDLTRGVYVQRIHRMTLDGSSDESIVRQTIGDISKIRLLITNRSIATKSNAELGCAMCDCAPRVYAGDPGTYAGHQGISVDKSGNVHLFLDSICQMTEAEIREWLSANPVYIMYGLASPIETTLSETEIAAYRALHSNYPNTTVLNDAGAHMVVKYAADTKLYIDNKIAALVGGV